MKKYTIIIAIIIVVVGTFCACPNTHKKTIHQKVPGGVFIGNWKGRIRTSSTNNKIIDVARADTIWEFRKADTVFFFFSGVNIYDGKFEMNSVSFPVNDSNKYHVGSGDYYSDSGYVYNVDVFIFPNDSFAMLNCRLDHDDNYGYQMEFTGKRTDSSIWQSK